MARTKITRLLVTFPVYLAVFICIFSGMPRAAEMPEYERLQPVTARLGAPTAVALDSNNNLYVTDLINGRLLVYSQTDQSLKKLLRGLDKPISVGVYGSDKIYVGIRGSGSVEVYDDDLNYIYELGSGKNPNAIAVGSDGKVYVADGKENLIKVYNPDGSFNFSFGSTGNGNGQFNFPSSIAIDEVYGEIIVSDFRQVYNWMWGWSSGARIQVFDMNGNFIRSFGQTGVGEGKLFRPMGVTVDSERRIYVTDSFQNVVQVFDHNGTYLGTVYDLDNPMRTPIGITISQSNRLYIASQNSSKVEVYRILGADAEPPTTSISISGNSGNNNWYVSDVQITLIAMDNEGGSGVSGTEYSFDNTNWNDYTAPFFISSEGTIVVYYRSIDNEGNVETAKSTTLKIDKTPPGITSSALPMANANDWNNTDVEISSICTDAVSGIAICPDIQTVSAEGSGQVIISTATDNAGNNSSTSIILNIDKTTPQITITVPADGAAYLLNQSVIADWSVTDEGSGIASSSGTVASGLAIDTSIVGNHNFTVSATDNADNSISQTAGYSAVYLSPNPDFFLPPVRNDRVFKLGSTVPVKFQLIDANGVYISTAVATIALQQYSGDEPIGEPIEATSTSGADTGNLFRYDSADNLYIYNLSTNSFSKGTWQIRVTLDDGTTKTVFIGFK